MRPTRTLACLAAATVALGACGGGDDDTATDEPTAPTASERGCVEDFDADADYFPDKVEATHSELWSAEYHGSYVVLSVPDSENEGETTLDYVLVRCGAPTPELSGHLAGAPVFEVPVERTVLNHGNGVSMLDEIDVIDTVVGFGDSVFAVADDPWVADVVERAADPVNLGEGDAVDFEATLGLEPDVVFLGGFGAGFSNVGDTVARGLPAVMISNRIESTPLGSAEWIKFVAPFYGREALANERFDEIEAGYEDVAAKVSDALEADFRAAYFCIDPNRGCEFMAGHGPRSLNGHILDTLGTTNVFAEGNDAPNGKGFDYEQSLGRAADADFFVVYDRLSIIEELLAGDARFSEFAPFREGRYIGFIDSEYPRCRFTSSVRVDHLILDYGLGMAPDLFEGEKATCFGAPT